MIPTQPGPIAVDSSLLASAAYDADESVLQLEFRDGAIYRWWLKVCVALKNLRRN
jgi:KTSC domain